MSDSVASRPRSYVFLALRPGCRRIRKKRKTRGRREGERSGGLKETEGVEGDGGRERGRRGRGREGRSGVRKNGERERERIKIIQP